MLKFTLSFFHWKLYHNKLVHAVHQPLLNIFHKRVIVLYSHIFILNLSQLLVNLRIHKPNTKTK